MSISVNLLVSTLFDFPTEFHLAHVSLTTTTFLIHSSTLHESWKKFKTREVSVIFGTSGLKSGSKFGFNPLIFHLVLIQDPD